VEWSGNSKAQCGYHGEKQLTYDVTIIGREIDCPQGWLVDNNDIPAYFVKTYSRVRTFRSCEEIASRACDDFRKQCSVYGARPSYIRVAVSGIENSEIACEWRSRTHGV
jgi:hypothetical protein